MQQTTNYLKTSLAAISILIIGLIIQLTKPGNTPFQKSQLSETSNTVSKANVELHKEATRERKETPTDPTLTSSQFFDIDGEMDERLLTLAGIPVDRREEAEAIFESHKERAVAKMSSRIEKITEADDNSDSAYKIPAAPDQASALNLELSRELESHFGRGAAKILLSHLTNPAFLASSGQYDLTVKSKTARTGESRNHHKTVQIIVSDPKTGKIISERSTRKPNIYQVYLGNLLKNEILAGDWDNASP